MIPSARLVSDIVVGETPADAHQKLIEQRQAIACMTADDPGLDDAQALLEQMKGNVARADINFAIAKRATDGR